jgi:putative tricarboxylic transport membrane protein
MTRLDMIPFIFWILLSFFVMIFSYKLDLGSLYNPGPGFTPFLLGALLFAVSLYSMIRYFMKKKEADEAPIEVRSQVNYGKISFVLASLLGYSILFERLGFILSTSFFLVLLFRVMGNSWMSVLIGSAITVFITYFMFTFLGVRFP